MTTLTKKQDVLFTESEVAQAIKKARDWANGLYEAVEAIEIIEEAFEQIKKEKRS